MSTYEEPPPLLDYAVPAKVSGIRVLSRPRAVVFLGIAACPTLAKWPAVSLLGSRGWVIAGVVVAASLFTAVLALAVPIVWQAIWPLRPVDLWRHQRRWKRTWIALAVIAALTPTGLPTRAILITHIPFVAHATRDLTPGSQAPVPNDVRYVGLYRCLIDTSRGGVSVYPDPWWGLGHDEGVIAYDDVGERTMVWDTASSGRLIGKWIWWDLE